MNVVLIKNNGISRTTEFPGIKNLCEINNVITIVDNKLLYGLENRWKHDLKVFSCQTSFFEPNSSFQIQVSVQFESNSRLIQSNKNPPRLFQSNLSLCTQFVVIKSPNQTIKKTQSSVHSYNGVYTSSAARARRIIISLSKEDQPHKLEIFFSHFLKTSSIKCTSIKKSIS